MTEPVRPPGKPGRPKGKPNCPKRISPEQPLIRDVATRRGATGITPLEVLVTGMRIAWERSVKEDHDVTGASGNRPGRSGGSYQSLQARDSLHPAPCRQQSTFLQQSRSEII